MTTPPNASMAVGSRRSGTEVVVSIEQLPGGCKLFRLQWPDRKPD